MKVAVILSAFVLAGCSASQQAAEAGFLNQAADDVCRLCAVRAALAAPSASSSAPTPSSPASAASVGAPR